MLAFADRTLSAPPARSHIVRPVPRGDLVARFALPLELCRPQNRRDGAGPAWALAKTKAQLAQVMATQWLRQRGGIETPLTGRPQVLCLRFSSVEPDGYADWAKAAVDILTSRGRGHRLGIIVDDRPSCADVVQWWEPAKPGAGGVLVQVFRGEE
jgi:hypothetical protein